MCRHISNNRNAGIKIAIQESEFEYSLIMGLVAFRKLKPASSRQSNYIQLNPIESPKKKIPLMSSDIFLTIGMLVLSSDHHGKGAGSCMEPP